MLKFQFDANQPYQLKAIQSVTDLFKQQPFDSAVIQSIGGAAVIPNILRLNNQDLLRNLQVVQEVNGLEISAQLKGWDFSIEMETGTGKTYIYLRTILALHKQYGFRKFIIIVPSIAIREGVLKILQITRDHFEGLYDGLPYRYSVYQSKALSQLRQFALSDSVEILIMTIDSFNKDSNVINNYTDRLAGARPIDLIRATHPILILDEPQNMEGEKTRSSLSSLNPLCTLRYSATHRHYYNLIYRLTPYNAYQRGLVKQIEVYSITEMAVNNQAYISVNEIFRKDGTLLVKLKVNARDRRGNIRNKAFQFKCGDSLYSRAKLPAYKDLVISEINLKEKMIQFTDGKTLRLGQITGSDRQLIMKSQMEVAIREHLEKKEKLRPLGIKNLTLFFIDRVDNYLNRNGWIRVYFEKMFKEMIQGTKIKNQPKVTDVHQGYFSRKKTEKAMKQDREAFDLIMRDKERLLSLDEPVEFIFSHSALREGWDNPNVFNICTLNYSHSQIKKRQEIGRGIRLCVNHTGERILDPQLNRLTVIANENYAEYVSQLQTEYDEEYGQDVPKPKIQNANSRIRIRPIRDFQKNPHFQKIWRKISCKTTFEIQLNNAAFQRKCVDEIDYIKVHPWSVTLTKAKAELRARKFRAENVSQKTLSHQKNTGIQIRQIIEEIQMATGLTRNTVIDLLSHSASIRQMVVNPVEYTSKVIEIVRSNLRSYINEGIFYKRSNSRMNLKGIRDSNGYENQLITAKKTYFPFLSFSTNTEREFITTVESYENVLFYIKIPTWFLIQTPYGKYNPEWALLINKGGRSAVSVYDLMLHPQNDPQVESQQHCAERHFDSLGVEYVRISSSEDLEQQLVS